jgi:predicted nucleic acid-binding protein
VRNALRSLRFANHEIKTSPQNLAEFWNVSTRPASKNGFGQSVVDADRSLRVVERVVGLLPDSPHAYSQWRRLVVQYSVQGVQVHDTRLAAVMIVSGITHILTFNTNDFARFSPEGIVAVDPAGV